MSLFLVYRQAEVETADSGASALLTVGLGAVAVVAAAISSLVVNVVVGRRRAKTLSLRFVGFPLVHSGASVEFRNRIPRILRNRKEPGTAVPFATYELLAGPDGLSFWSGLFAPSVFFEIPWAEVKRMRIEQTREINGVYGSIVFELEVNGASFDLPVRVDSEFARIFKGEHLSKVRAIAQQVAAFEP